MSTIIPTQHLQQEPLISLITAVLIAMAIVMETAEAVQAAELCPSIVSDRAGIKRRRRLPRLQS